MNEDNQNDKSFYNLCIIAFVLSSFSSIILNLLLRKKQSNYSKLMRYICLAEAILIYAEFILITRTYYDTIDSFFTKPSKYLFFGA